MGPLMSRALQGRVTAVLIGHHPLIHDSTHNPEDLGVEEKLGRKAGRLKWHRQKIAMRTAVGLVPVSAEVVQQNRPKACAAGFDQRPGEVRFEDAETLILNFSHSLFG